MSVAERLYCDTPALEFSARVTDVRLDSRDAAGQLWQIALDRTAFYPAGGGQPCDAGTLTATSKSGAMLAVLVERVEEDEAGEVWHYVRKPLIQDTAVTGRVDAGRRLDHMQQHSGQHLLSAVFLKELHVPTVGFHLGADNVTIDLAVEKISEEDLQRVELSANLRIAENRTVTSSFVPRSEAEAMLARGDLQKLPERTGAIRLVEIAGVEWNACGGTHVAATGAIGSILLRRTEKIKRGQRIEFCCGLRAIAAARRDRLLLRQSASTLSVGMADVPARVERLLAEAKAAAKQLKAVNRQQGKSAGDAGESAIQIPTVASDKLGE